MKRVRKGPNPNLNAHCNKYVYIQGDKGHCKARVVDTCPKCADGKKGLPVLTYTTTLIYSCKGGLDMSSAGNNKSTWH